MSSAEVPLSDHEFNKFRKLIYEIAGISLSERKRELVKSRLARRLRALDLESYGEYYELLCDPRRSASELEHFTNALTTNKTEFFREAHHFEYLRNQFFPGLRQATLAGREKKLRIWCAAASTGQEPYTLAMTMLDYFGPSSDWDMRLLASDIDTQVLAKAQEGLYPENEMDGIPTGLRNKYFQREARGDDPTWRVKPELKQLITFRQLNLNHPDWPINVQFDAIFCRNVMIYFDHETQTRLVERFAQYLLPNGLLVIGHSESLFAITDIFDSLGDTIYKLNSAASSKRRGKPFSGLADGTKAVAAAPLTVPKDSTGAQPTNVRMKVTNSESSQKHLSKLPVSAANANHPQEPIYIATKTLVLGEYEASREEGMLQTVLGSCVAACLFDPTRNLGGMNHFMLPESQGDDTVCARFGVHAMELLINAIMKLGGNRRSLIAKIFGGARVVEGFSQSWDVGKHNVDFVRRFLATERIPIVAEHVLGESGRRIKFLPTTGKVFVALLDRKASINAERAEQARPLPLQPSASSVTLWHTHNLQ